MEIISVSFRLLIVYLLVISNFDKLITFAVLGLCVSIIIQTIYMFYCHRKFEECTYRFIWNKVIFQKMLAFAGWNFIGSGSAVLKSQGINILLNLFYGVIVNAAQGVANKVNTVINGFAMNISVAINPQITKSYASGDYDRLMALIYKGTKLIFFLLLFLTLPVMIETEIIMKLWLKLVPDYTIIFIRLILVETVINSLSSFLITAMLATGKIRNYQLVVGGIYFLNIPFSYLFMKLGFPPYITIIVAIFFAICCLFARLYMLRNMIKLSAKKYFSEVVVKALVVTAISLIFPLICYFSIEQGLGRFFIVCFVCVISSLTSIYYLGLAKSEKVMVLENIKLFINKFQR